jgi:hypothetical protein
MNARTFVGTIGICAVLLAGCYKKEVQQDGAIVFSFQPWVPLLVIVGGVAAVPVGFVLWPRGQRTWGAGCVILGVLAVVGLAPGMFLDKVSVGPEGFYSRHGLWFSPQTHSIRYEELAHVRVTVEERGSRRRRTYSYYFDCYFKNGGQERVPLGDIMREALPEIADQFRKHGVQVYLPPNLPD